MNRSEERAMRCEHKFDPASLRCSKCALAAHSIGGATWLVKVCNQLDDALMKMNHRCLDTDYKYQDAVKQNDQWAKEYERLDGRYVGYKIAFWLSATLLLFMLALFTLNGIGVI